MIGRLISVLWTIITLPVKLILLPFRIASFIVSVVVYGLALIILAGAIYFLII